MYMRTLLPKQNIHRLEEVSLCGFDQTSKTGVQLYSDTSPYEVFS